MKTHRHPQTGSTCRIAWPSEEDLAMAQATCEKIGEVRPCGFRVTRADRQTDILITILHIPPGGEVTN